MILHYSTQGHQELYESCDKLRAQGADSSFLLGMIKDDKDEAVNGKGGHAVASRVCLLVAAITCLS